ncbi:MAG: serine/threonine protein kinase [Myxococcales bacterium]|nr:serine/threonine protein kinase [Myxococcales bacterium]
MSPVRPKSVGSTTLGEVLGAGGMAEVVLGVQEPLERKVAVKALLPELKEDPEATERFRREALALAALQHENIIAVHDLLEKFGRTYLVMEYVDGVTLETILRAGPLPIDIALLVGAGVAAALEHAHFRRVIHRDIKPGNVMLSRSGQVKLTDFGIAKDLTQDDLTRKGLVIGTPRYLSPEQASGQRADARSDIFSLGVLLYQMLSGQLPHSGQNTAELLIAIARGQRKRLREIAPRLPKSVVRVVERCLEVDPARRYQGAAELRRDLEHLLAAILKGSAAARLVAFLKERGQISEDSLTLIASEEVAAASPITSPETVLKFSTPIGPTPRPRLRRLSRWLLMVIFSLLLVAGGTVAVGVFAPNWTRATLATIATWLAPTQDGG